MTVLSSAFFIIDKWSLYDDNEQKRDFRLPDFDDKLKCFFGIEKMLTTVPCLIYCQLDLKKNIEIKEIPNLMHPLHFLIESHILYTQNS